MADRVKIPLLNPIRFYRDRGEIDYDNYFPTSDLMRIGTQYQRGIYPVDYRPELILGKTMTCQVTLVLPISTFRIQVFRNGVEIPLAIFPVNVTPTGWDSTEIIYNFSYTPTETGDYYYYLSVVGSGISNTDTWYYSDTFKVIDELEEKKGIVEINYFDSKNRYGGVFDNGTENIWSPTAYYTGNILSATPEDENSVFEAEEGPIVSQSAPKRVYILNITDINMNYRDVIKQQSVCNNYIVNGSKYAALDFSTEPAEKSDIINISIKLTLQENDYYYNY
jgi:hypothetical protein